jgi:hypothetical protein
MTKGKPSKRYWVMSLVTLMSVGLTSACTDEQVAFGTGAAIGAIGGYAIADRHDGRRDRCYRRQVCNGYRDYYGRWRRGCRMQRICRGGHWASNYAMANGVMYASTPSSGVQERLSAIAVGNTFAMSYEGADKLIYALEQSAYYKNHEPVKALGLSGYDAGRLAKKKLPSNSGVKKIAKALDQDPGATQQMIQLVVDAM